MTNEKLTYKINNLHINQTQPKKKKHTQLHTKPQFIHEKTPVKAEKKAETSNDPPPRLFFIQHFFKAFKAGGR